MFSETRNKEAAEKFFKQVLANGHCGTPRVISVDKNGAYPPAFKVDKDEKLIPEGYELRQIKYLNNIIEQDYRFSKKRVRHRENRHFISKNIYRWAIWDCSLISKR